MEKNGEKNCKQASFLGLRLCCIPCNCEGKKGNDRLMQFSNDVVSYFFSAGTRLALKFLIKITTVSDIIVCYSKEFEAIEKLELTAIPLLVDSRDVQSEKRCKPRSKLMDRSHRVWASRLSERLIRGVGVIDPPCSRWFCLSFISPTPVCSFSFFLLFCTLSSIAFETFSLPHSHSFLFFFFHFYFSSCTSHST